MYHPSGFPFWGSNRVRRSGFADIYILPVFPIVTPVVLMSSSSPVYLGLTPWFFHPRHLRNQSRRGATELHPHFLIDHVACDVVRSQGIGLAWRSCEEVPRWFEESSEER